jgi:transcription initiation factor TFIID subunit TAF12
MKGTNYRPQQRQYHRQSQYQAQQQSHTVNNSSASTTSSDDFILPPTKQPDSTGVASLLGGQNTQPKLKRKLLPKKKAAATNATAIASGATALDAVSADADGNVATVHTSNFGDENEDKKTLKRVKNESTDVSLPGAEGERDQPEKSDAGEGGLLGLDYGSDAD